MKRKEEYDFLSIKISNYRAYVDAGINHEVRVKKYQYDDAKIYEFSSHVIISGICNWPEEREGDEYEFTVYGSNKDFDITLKECHVFGKDGMRQYKKIRGKEVPVYDIPKGLGTIDKVRGVDLWDGNIWVTPQTASSMQGLLSSSSIDSLYVFVHERKIERNRWVVGFTLQTSDPSNE